MGNNLTAEQIREAEILRKPKKGEASPLYWACRNGDVDAVRKIVAETRYEKLNQLEPNGSTALHAAAHNGHEEIVRILLHEKGVMRNRQNLYHLTAYEEAITDEIRALFERPEGPPRFCGDVQDFEKPLVEFFNDVEPEDDNSDSDDDVEREDDNSDLDGDVIENEWLKAAKSPDHIRLVKASANISKKLVHSPMLRTIMSVINNLREDGPTGQDDEILDENIALNKIESLIDLEVAPGHKKFDQASQLLSLYKKTGDIQYLLRLYTLETPFYSIVNKMHQKCLLTPIFSKLSLLQNRAHQGTAYRGLKMTREDLRPYQWLLKHRTGVLVFQNICSSSTDRYQAMGFIHDVSHRDIKVLMLFDFPQKCETAIRLFEVSDAVPAISEHPDEYEVLILPCTLFRVTDIKYNRHSDLYEIYLKNFSSNAGIFALLRSLYRQKFEKS